MIVATQVGMGCQFVELTLYLVSLSRGKGRLGALCTAHSSLLVTASAFCIISIFDGTAVMDPSDWAVYAPCAARDTLLEKRLNPRPRR